MTGQNTRSWLTINGMTLSEEEKQRVAARVAAFETATGVELVTTLVPRCDDYPELPWKAFALGSAAGIGLVVLAPIASVMALLVVLGAGLLSAALAVFVPLYARCFLSAARAAGEVRQAAQALFLENELFHTRTRTGVLMLVSTFERHVHLLADRGLRAKLPDSALSNVTAAMTTALRRGDSAAAFLTGIDRLEQQVRATGFTGGADVNALPDHLEPGNPGGR